MSYLVLARKYRPMRFSEMVGQGHITRTLANAIAHDRVHHAYLFCGVRGLGKTTAARILARGLVCEKGASADPCNECGQCRAVIDGQSVDVREIDGASNNSVEDIRALRERVHYMPQSARRKIYIIDEVHMLSASAFNALLKTLEEPPAHVTFIFATTDPHKVLPTIMSRVSRLEFRRVTSSDLVDHLKAILAKESVGMADEGLALVARASEGSVRDALTLLDKMIAFADDPKQISAEEVRDILGAADPGLVGDLIDALIERQASVVLDTIERACSAQQDMTQLGLAILAHLRDIAVVQASPAAKLEASEMRLDRIKSQAKRWPRAQVFQAFDRFGRCLEQLDRSRAPRLTLEMGLLDLVHAPELLAVADIVQQLQSLADGGTTDGGTSSGGGAGPRSGGGASRGSTPPAGARPATAQPNQAPATANPQPTSPRPTSSTATATTASNATPEKTNEPPSNVSPAATKAAAEPTPSAGDNSSTSPESTNPDKQNSSEASPPPQPSPSPDAATTEAEAAASTTVSDSTSEAAQGVEEPAAGTVAHQLWSLLSDAGAIEAAKTAAPPGATATDTVDASANATPGSGGGAAEPTTKPNKPGLGDESTPRAETQAVDPNAPLPPLPDHFSAWESLVDALRGVDDLLYAVLCDLGVGAIEGKKLQLATRKGSFPFDQMAARPEMRSTLERMLASQLELEGYDLIDAQANLRAGLPSLQLVLAERERAHIAGIEAEARSHPGIQSVIRAFDGRLREVVPLLTAAEAAASSGATPTNMGYVQP